MGKVKLAKNKLLKFFRDYPKISLALKVIIVFILFFLISWRSLDPDFGWHLTSGNYIRQHGIPSHDIYTYTAPNFPWINHEWGNDVLVSLLYGAGGYLLLALVYSGIWTLALMLGAGAKTRLVILLVGVAPLMEYSGIRPVAWTALMLVILLRMISSKSNRVRSLIPLLFLPWANLHAGFVIGLAALAFYAIKERRRTWMYILAASILVTFLNPYGPRLYVEVFRTLLDSRLHRQILEWYPFHMSRSAWLFTVLWGSGFWLFTRGKLSSWFNFSLLLLLSSLSANRNVPLFVVASLKSLDGYYSQAKEKLSKRLNLPRRLIVWAFAATVLAVTFFGIYSANDFAVVNREAQYPQAAVAYLKQHPCSGNLFNSYDYGGYLIWKLPQEKVFIDGRMPSWRDPQGIRYLDTYFNVLANKNEQAKEFSKYDIRCAVMKGSTDDLAFMNRLLHAHWKLVSRSNDSFLFIAPK